MKEAESILKENDLKIQYDKQEEKINKETKIIHSQVPNAGITVNAGSTIRVLLQ